VIEEEMTEPVIELEEVNFGYGPEAALQDITLTIDRGNYDGIIGPNGGGKTTLLKIILGLLKPTSGTVRLFGQNLEDFKDGPKIGYLPQNIMQSGVRFPITVREAVVQGRVARVGLFRRFSRADFEAVDRALEMSDVIGFKDRLISDLSGGERQRVFIARALAGEPEILILDEPVTGIDVGQQSSFYRFLKDLNAEHGITILFASHDIDILAHETTRLICINRRLVCDGAAALIFKENKKLLKELYGDKIQHMYRDEEDK
jgi:zinc transport system ATP-binding protein